MLYHEVIITNFKAISTPADQSEDASLFPLGCSTVHRLVSRVIATVMGFFNGLSLNRQNCNISSADNTVLIALSLSMFYPLYSSLINS